MPKEEKIIYVYDNFTGDEPVLLGKLNVGVIKGGESYSFEYDKDWLAKNKLQLNLDPELLPFVGRQFPKDKNIFGIFADASPDRWGRVLMNKRERLLAERENRKPSKLYDSDYLLGVYDETRMGGIRFKLDREGPFLSDDKETATPPWTSLRSLEEASRNFENDEGGVTDRWLNQLIRPGSSLGGARPKATVADTKGQLWIAKFPSKNDDSDTGAWEKVVHDLAGMCGLNVPESVPYGDELSLLVDDEDNSISIELAVQTASHFGIQKKEAVVYAEDILAVVRNNWEKLAKRYGLLRGQIEYMRPAFDICYR